ncbi:MAG: class I SAM-dependent methyltransferase [Candidatus Dormibacteria bacterium]
MSIHPAAQVGFARVAAAYERGRPDYPQAAVGWLAARLGLGAGRLVVDLGAGTGKLTRQLLPFGSRVLAVEPVAEMADQLRQAVAGVEVRATTADHTGLASGSVDAVTAGQAFHWFADPPTLAEIHRVLRPRGRLGLVWNRRDPRSPLWVEINQLLRPLQQGTPEHSTGDWRRRLEASGLFGPMESRAFEHEHRLTREGLLDRVLSLSFVGVLDASTQARLRERVLELASEFFPEPARRVTLLYRTEVFACSAA